MYRLIKTASYLGICNDVYTSSCYIKRKCLYIYICKFQGTLFFIHYDIYNYIRVLKCQRVWLEHCRSFTLGNDQHKRSYP